MRLSKEKRLFIRDKLHQLIPGGRVYLFGSRVDDHKRGGDLDILILSDDPVDRQLLRKFKVDFINGLAGRG